MKKAEKHRKWERSESPTNGSDVRLCSFRLNNKLFFSTKCYWL